MKTLASIPIVIGSQLSTAKLIERSLPLNPWKLPLQLLAGLVFAVVVGQGTIAQALMEQGDQGEGVRRLQKALNITVDGIYGDSTYEAVVSFQRRKNLQVDGVAGTRTLAALELPSDLEPNGQSVTSVASSGKVSARVVNVYASAAVTAPVRYKLHKSDRIVYTGRSINNNGYFWQEVNGGGWVKQERLYGNRPSGIGSDTEVGVQAIATVTASSLVVRDAPAGAPVGELDYGARVALTGGQATANGISWVELTSGNWVAEDYIRYR